MTRFFKNPALSYLTISPDEVSIQGSPLDGFSLLAYDDQHREIAAPLIAALATPLNASEARAQLPVEDVSVEDVESYLEELAAAGALLRSGHRCAADEDWIAYARYGEISHPQHTHPIVVAGDNMAALLVQRLTDLGLTAEHRAFDAIGPLSAFTARERRSAPGEDTDGDADLEPRLVVASPTLALTDLYALNAQAIPAQAPILYIQTSGVQYAVGPYVVPGSTACFFEFERQQARARDDYSTYAAHTAAGSGGRAPSVTTDAAAATAMPFLVELALRGESTLAGRVVRGRATTADVTRHSVLRLPRCPVCLPTRPMLRNPLY